MQKLFNFLPDALKYWVGFQWVSLTLWEEGASLSFVGHCSSGPVTIKIPYGVVVLLHQALTHLFLLGWLRQDLNR